MKKEYHCRVCGFFLEEERMLGDICPCCDVEFGYTETDPIGAIEYREHWLTSMQGKWQSSFWGPPENWNLEQQLKQIPKEFQGPDDFKILAQLKEKNKDKG